MRILSENTVLNVHAPSVVRRVVSIAVGLFLGVTLSLTSVQADHPATSVVSENPASPQRLFPTPGSKLSTPVTAARERQRGWHEIGLASWYGREFQGKQTANGETFNMNDLTCAHRSLPLDTWVKVTNLRTRKWIVVRVNDRGPVPETRIADLSSQAAKLLGMRSRGVTRVRLDVIDPQQAAEAARLERLRLARQAAEAALTAPGN